MKSDKTLSVLLVLLACQFLASGADCGNFTHILYVNSTADAAALSTCGTVDDDIFIVSPSSLAGNVSLDGLQQINGQLISYNDAQITGIHSNSLGEISTDLHFDNLAELRYLSFPQLRSISWILAIRNLPALATLELARLETIGQAVLLDRLPALNLLKLASGATAGSVSTQITNTGLERLSLSFLGTSGGVYIGANPHMSEVALNLATIVLPTVDNTAGIPNLNFSDWAGNLVVTENAPGIRVNFPGLQSVANNLVVDECAELSIPLLGVVNGSLLMRNASFSSLSGPNLAMIDQDLTITGNFTSLSFPALHRVNGNLYIQSSKPLDCSAFQEMSANGNIGGSFLCEGSLTSVSTTTTGSRPVGNTPSTSTATANSPLSAGLSGGEKGGIIAGSVIGALTLVALVAFLVIYRRRKASSTSNPSTKQAEGPTEAADRKQPESYEQSFGTRQERAELAGSPEQSSNVRGHAELVALPNQVSELHG